MLISSYPSQLTYGPLGSILCTPVSCAMAVSFLEQGDVAFSHDNVRRLMQCSHAFLASSSQRHMRMTSELIQDFIPSSVAYHEIAGLTTSMPHGAPIMDSDSTLLICPLQKLLAHCSRTACAAVVTMRAHTTAFLMDGSGSILFFDPLPAVLQDHYDLPTATEYSGLLLYKKNKL